MSTRPSPRPSSPPSLYSERGQGGEVYSHQDAQGEGFFYHDNDRPMCANPACNNPVMIGVSGRYLKYCARDACRKNAFYHRRQGLIKQLSYDNPTTSHDNSMAQALQAQAQALTNLAAVLASLRPSPSLYSERGVGGEVQVSKLDTSTEQAGSEMRQHSSSKPLSETELLDKMELQTDSSPPVDKKYYGWVLTWKLWLMTENNNVDACLLKYGDEAIQWGIRVGALPTTAFDRQAELLAQKGPAKSKTKGGSGNAKSLANAPEELPPPEELDLDLL
jgi:hypothetical protein